jgi:muconolactone delta-isomerase
MVVATFKPGTNMAEVLAVVAEEQSRIAELEAEGRIGALYLATTARQTVFLEVRAQTDVEVVTTVESLPMARWWDLDVFPLNRPADGPDPA